MRTNRNCIHNAIQNYLAMYNPEIASENNQPPQCRITTKNFIINSISSTMSNNRTGAQPCTHYIYHQFQLVWEWKTSCILVYMQVKSLFQYIVRICYHNYIENTLCLQNSVNRKTSSSWFVWIQYLNDWHCTKEPS